MRKGGRVRTVRGTRKEDERQRVREKVEESKNFCRGERDNDEIEKKEGER